MKWNEKNVGVYEIVNTLNGKKYVGKSISLYRRKYQHFVQLKGNKHYNQHLQNAFNNYGGDNFIFNVIEECDKDILGEREYYWISKYRVWDRDFGYNIELINEDGTNVKSYESIKKLKRSIKNSNYKKPKGKDNPTSKEVHQYSLAGDYIQSFESCHLAADFYGKHKSFTTISKVARKCIGTSLGFQWRYFKQGKIDPYIDVMNEVRTNNNIKQSKKVIAINLETMKETEYDSISEASKILGLGVSSIARIVSGERNKSTKLNMTFKEI